MRDRKNGIGRQAVLAAVFAGALSMGTVSADALAFNFGPGMEDHEVIIYDGQAANNPAYDNGGAGPGEVGNNPMGNQGQTEEEALSGGPNSEAAKKYLEDQERSLYIFSTYRGGTWEKLEDGKWRLMASDGQPVSSQWGYVDGKTYLLDMYGIMQTGWQMVNGKWYYLNSVGAMQTGWLLKEGKYYFLNADGSMAAGWVNSQGIWYYFDKQTGVMQTNTYVDDGRYVNAEGALVP